MATPEDLQIVCQEWTIMQVGEAKQYKLELNFHCREKFWGSNIETTNKCWPKFSFIQWMYAQEVSTGYLLDPAFAIAPDFLSSS